MINFKTTTNISGKIKGICMHNGLFMDYETGEEINLASILESQYGEDTPFDLSTTLKTETDNEVGGAAE